MTRRRHTPLLHALADPGRGRSWLLAGLAAALASSAHAQSAQYTPTGSFLAPPTSVAESIAKAADEARFRVGILRLDPWFGIRNVGYTDNVYGTAGGKQEDFTATVGAGLRGYVRMGPKAVIALHALPEYVWWVNLADRRTLNGRTGAGVFGYFNRLALEAEATLSRQDTYVSSEAEPPVETRLGRLAGGAELALDDHVSVFGQVAREDWRFPDNEALGPRGAEIAALERTEDAVKGGLRYALRNGLRLGAGVQVAQADFADGELDRSNRDLAPIAEVRVARTRLDADLKVAYRSMEPTGASRFVPFDGFTGRFRAVLRPGARLQYVLSGRRDLVYTAYESPEAPYFVSERLGAGVVSAVGWRLALHGFVEVGPDRYVPYEPGALARHDDVLGIGGGFGFLLKAGTRLQVGVSRVRYESNASRQDRTVFRIQTSISKGRGDSPWF